MKEEKRERGKHLAVCLFVCCLWYRAAKETFDLEKCVGVDLSEDMLRVAEQLEGNNNGMKIYA